MNYDTWNTRNGWEVNLDSRISGFIYDTVISFDNEPSNKTGNLCSFTFEDVMEYAEDNFNHVDPMVPIPFEHDIKASLARLLLRRIIRKDGPLMWLRNVDLLREVLGYPPPKKDLWLELCAIVRRLYDENGIRYTVELHEDTDSVVYLKAAEKPTITLNRGSFNALHWECWYQVYEAQKEKDIDAPMRRILPLDEYGYVGCGNW